MTNTTSESPTFAVVQALSAQPFSTPVLEALIGMKASIREDEASHYASVRMLVGFLSVYGNLDAAETASTEEGEAYRHACELLAELDVSQAIRFDADLKASIYADMIKPVA